MWAVKLSQRGNSGVLSIVTGYGFAKITGSKLVSR